ncbi:methyl-accepting chemotaxis protein [Desulfovibrio gilichinskyi]|uniref:Methyl-accepting chemotaxis protein n=1 Tax=Desulfovibrio gilichinskyi TaxID=1519643 RepID=A0A1X7EG26_9BACT|nr:methyl-accepting chemotaxis protein [Desulfovibrio gilichinskyi]SMF33335.1 methyl-accepting chemotaxis protein [Desulfovibrio gilichinskyi]
MFKRLLFCLASVLVLMILAMTFQKNILISLSIQAVAILFLMAAVFFVIKKVIHPIKLLNAQVKSISEGNFETGSNSNYICELGTLEHEVNKLSDMLNKKIGMSESMLSSIMTPMGVVGKDGNIIWLNESILKLLEIDGNSDKFIGTDFSVFFYGTKQETVSEKSLKEKKKLFAKTQVTSRKGNIKYISIAASPIFDTRGNLIGGFTTIMDFTNIKVKEDFITAQNEKIAKGVSDASKISEQLAKASETIKAEVNISSEGTREQRFMTEEVSSAMEQMNITITDVSKNANDTAHMARQTQTTAKNGTKLVSDVIDVMHNVTKNAQNLKNEMATLETHSNGISSIMQTISDIADQTNLLALNAAIEAARAGTAGLGFSVVADEIRKLAEKTMVATKDVGHYIASIQSSSNQSTEATTETLLSIKEASRICDEAGKALEQILGFSQNTADQVDNIAAAAEQQSIASGEVNNALDEVNKIAAKTADSMNKAAESVSDLAQLATELDHNMNAMQKQEKA